MSNFSTDMMDLQFEVNRTIREHWQMFLFEGAILILLGIVAITVRRQNIWLRLGLRLGEFRPHHGVDIKRRSCGAASVDVG
jgi:cytochrome c biogenesis protein ResB